jgi:hypothetical protein
VRFATIPAQVRLTKLAALAREAIPADLPPLEAARERALAELVSRQLVCEDRPSSAEIAGRVGARGEQETSAEPTVGEAEIMSSPTPPAQERPAGFWLNVNAELVIYGATEADASVTFGGRPISLRPDGTFSRRLALPDGDHAVTVSAMSAQGDLRQAELRFRRRTKYQGDVGAAPQDPSLQPPGGETP